MTDIVDPTITQIATTAAIELIMIPIVVFVLKHTIGKRLDAFDAKRDMARDERLKRYEREDKWQDAVTKGLRSILRAELISEHRKAMRDGFCDVETKGYVERTYNAYHDLGGNDLGTRLYDEIMDLPSKPTDGSD